MVRADLGSDGNKDFFYIPLSSRNTETSTSDCLVSYLEQSLENSISSAEIQLVYSAVPVDWATKF